MDKASSDIAKRAWAVVVNAAAAKDCNIETICRIYGLSVGSVYRWARGDAAPSRRSLIGLYRMGADLNEIVGGKKRD